MREARAKRRIDLGVGGEDDQPARRDRKLRRGAAIGAVLGVMREQDAAVHQDDDDERKIDGERGGAPGRGPTPHDGAPAMSMNAAAA